MWPNPQFPADLVTFAEEISNGKLHFLCSDYSNIADAKTLLIIWFRQLLVNRKNLLKNWAVAIFDSTTSK